MTREAVMGDLSKYLPKISPTVRAIYALHVERAKQEDPRGYLGGSQIGKECERALWYGFRGLAPMRFSPKPGEDATDAEGRLRRLFETGHLEEARFVDELRGIGCEVLEVDPQTGNQWRIEEFGGHFAGHADGVTLGLPEAPKTWHLLEFKTHNAKSFKVLRDKGVKAHKPEHWAQCQVYMRGLKLKRAMYLARNKDTDELYSERIEYDAKAAQALVDKAARIVKTSKPPERIASRPDDFRCKWCDAHALCWGTSENVAVPIPRATCRSCCHSTPDTESGAWTCERYSGMGLADTGVGAECPSHLLLPGLIHFAEATDSDGDWIEYKSADGTTWRQGPESDHYSSAELIESRGPIDGPKVEAPKSLIDAYPPEESELVWDGPSDELEAAVGEYVGHDIKTSRYEETKTVRAREHLTSSGCFLVVDYTECGHAAIWRGKE